MRILLYLLHGGSTVGVHNQQKKECYSYSLYLIHAYSVVSHSWTWKASELMGRIISA